MPDRVADIYGHIHLKADRTIEAYLPWGHFAGLLYGAFIANWVVMAILQITNNWCNDPLKIGLVW